MKIQSTECCVLLFISLIFVKALFSWSTVYAAEPATQLLRVSSLPEEASKSVKSDSSDLATLKLSNAFANIPSVSPNPTAIIMFVRGSKINSLCHRERIRHLVYTTMDLGHDVFIFIDGQQNITAEISTSSQRRIKHTHNFKEPIFNSKHLHFIYWTAKGLKTLFPNFYDETGSSKLFTLLFMMKYSYDYVWHLESDAFFTGNWSTFFRYYSFSGADILTRKSDRGEAIGIVYRMSPYAQENKDIAEKVAWPIIRLSRSFVKKLIPFAMSEKMHHEVIGTVCNKLGETSCVIDYFDSIHLGHYALSKWGIYKPPINCCEFNKQYTQPDETGKIHSLDFRKEKLHRNALYHPFKCVDDDPNSMYWLPEILNRWYDN